jgi:hypothetical protein
LCASKPSIASLLKAPGIAFRASGRCSIRLYYS